MLWRSHVVIKPTKSRTSPGDICHGVGGVEVFRSIEHKKTAQAGFEPAPSERTRDGSFRPIVSSNRFKRLESVAVTVRLLGSLHCKSTFITKSQKTSPVNPTFLGYYQRFIPAMQPARRVSRDVSRSPKPKEHKKVISTGF
jgi:hypothetical protein